MGKASRNSSWQWGIVSALLTFSLVTLSGIVFRVDPFVIAQRALCSAGMTFLVTQFAIKAMELTISKRRKTWQR